MSYQVIARKYRPQNFAGVVGQEHITTTLKNALASGRIHHAYLFTGVRGVGKTTVARILAKALNCQHPRDLEPCGSCTPCIEITASRSMDVQEIDGASNTGVDSVREIREHVKYMPSSGKYKIYIIDEVHMLSTPAFNALLKTLEEPPAHVIFIFATTESHKIPATILSRCQRHDFRRIPPQLIAATLARIAEQEGVTVSQDALGLIAREATGSLRDAQSLFDQAIAYSGNDVTLESIEAMLGSLDRKLLFDLLSSAFNKDTQAALKVLDEVFITGSDLSRFGGDILELLRHLLVISECGGERLPLDLPSDEISALSDLAKQTTSTQLHQMFSLWYGVVETVSRSPFPKMVLEVGIIRLCRVNELAQIDDIVSRLDAIIGGSASFAGQETQPVQQARAVAKQVTTPQRQQAPQQPPKSVEAAMPAERQAPPKQAEEKANPPSGPTFEAVPVDAESEAKWQEFLRWVIVERPQSAAILQQGELDGMDGSSVSIRFSNPYYSAMQSEVDRMQKANELLSAFFKRPMRLNVTSSGEKEDQPHAQRVQRKKDLVKEALKDDIVKHAQEILGAQLYDVKTSGK